jgi:hypothetical protein
VDGCSDSPACPRPTGSSRRTHHRFPARRFTAPTRERPRARAGLRSERGRDRV